MEKYLQNREVSWLNFNERVLELASDTKIPILERLKFLEIFASNLDEFFMIRVGTLYNMYNNKNKENRRIKDSAIYEEIASILEKSKRISKRKDEIEELVDLELKKEGIEEVPFENLQDNNLKYIKKYFKEFIKPILSPQIIDKHHPFPFLNNKENYLLACIKIDGKKKIAMIPIPKSAPNILFVPSERYKYIRLEDIISYYASNIFSDAKIIESCIIRVTRNEEINYGEENAYINVYFEDMLEYCLDYRHEMRKILHKRKRLSVVRLEYRGEMSDEFNRYLCSKLKIKKEQFIESKTPFNQNKYNELEGEIIQEDKEKFLYKPYKAKGATGVNIEQSLMKQVSESDILLSYPYESMETFLNLIKEASRDSSVISIKITIYRLSNNSKLIDYLCYASENNITVTVLIELRARYDEDRNIKWSERLEASGCNVIYGVEGYKVHSKICLITKKEGDSIQYITQIGTGNYNDITAKVYTDLSLITSNKEIGLDAVTFFQNMGIGNLKGEYTHLMVAPLSMKKEIIMHIENEIKLGDKGYIGVKVNGLSDMDIMNKLIEASNSGVEIDLCVRGICCLLPNVTGFTDGIKIHSIVGRFLEHSRIYIFGKNKREKIYISSADWLLRNTQKRVEVAVPILDDQIKEKIRSIFQLSMLDNVNGKTMESNGNYVGNINNDICYDSHKILMELSD